MEDYSKINNHKIALKEVAQTTEKIRDSIVFVPEFKTELSV